jgi:tubulin polyglutamylase TTLL9
MHKSSNIKYKTTFKNTVLDSLKKRQWKECDEENNWDIYWAEKEWIQDIMDNIHLSHNQRINHFRNHFEVMKDYLKLTRKDLMIKNLKRFKKQLEKERKFDEANTYLMYYYSYNFFPVTYNLPAEYSIFFEEFKRNQSSSNNYWIMKPVFLLNLPN